MGYLQLFTKVEASFGNLEQKLSLRPVFHRLSHRIHAHIFVTVLAYHLLCVIQRQLGLSGIHHPWKTIRTNLASQVRVTTTLVNDKKEVIHIRQTSEPEPFHFDVYRALGINRKPLRTIKKIE